MEARTVPTAVYVRAVRHGADEHRALIARFYAAFAARDGDTMAACYRPDSTFEDPAFGRLDGLEAGAMWRMLTARGEDLEVELLEHDATDLDGHARWRATYTFTQTGRPVVNDVRASFRFSGDGHFREHVDRFSFHAWSRQALGTPGLLLGWTPVLRAQVRKQARAQLHRSMRG